MGMSDDSSAIISTMPGYPSHAMAWVINVARWAMM
jgi:hypothetical protein